jgi:tetrahydromethanopterin S-methyltransferase subunit A
MIRDNENIKLQYVKGGEITGFLIFDDSIFVRFINAIDSQGRKVSVAISIQENLTSDTIKDFCKRYCTMISDNYLPKKIKEDML